VGKKLKKKEHKPTYAAKEKRDKLDSSSSTKHLNAINREPSTLERIHHRRTKPETDQPKKLETKAGKRKQNTADTSYEYI
jgi:hypothetical protein